MSTKVECWHCHKKGHVRQDCPALAESKEEDEDTGGSDYNYHTEDAV